MQAMNSFLDAVNGVIWHNTVLYVVLGVGVLFTLWSAFCQYRAVTHGVQVVRGKYDSPDDPGAINHFQALSAALSATVGLGNIGGVALAIALGGPGAVFWMWVIGLAGMALKTTEVALSMLYRNVEDGDDPHGGPMWVASKGLAERGYGGAGKLVGGIFCITLLISAVTGGNMFQSWNVADVTYTYFGIPQVLTGIVLAVLVGMVIIGGIKRIGSVAGRLVPFMCLLYLIAAVYVILMRIDMVPAMLKLIVTSAFAPIEAQGAFIGGTFGYAFLWGMKRALFSSEAGQGSSPIAHSAAKTDEPIREAVVAGLEPFIDTIVVCTLTALVILCSGIWSRGPDHVLEVMPAPIAAVDGSGAAIPGVWTFAETPVPAETELFGSVKLIVAGDANENTGNELQDVTGSVVARDDGTKAIQWGNVTSAAPPHFAFGAHDVEPGGIFSDYTGASLTAKAFDSVTEGLGKWLVTFAAWLFAISTMISWSYYGEQGMIYLLGKRSVLPYKLIYCLLVIVAALPLIKTDRELDNLTALGTGVMLWANIPIMLVFGGTAMRAYHDYMGKLRTGKFHPHAAPSIRDVVEGHDVE